jgi:hypothetical protein
MFTMDHFTGLAAGCLMGPYSGTEIRFGPPPPKKSGTTRVELTLRLPNHHLERSNR